MPFLKPSKLNNDKLNRLKITARNGSRRAIFSPTSPAKDKYMGEWKDDKKHGKGSEISRHDWLYEGGWVMGRKHGFGVLSKILKTGAVCNRYAGHWLEGKKQGHGSYWYPGGSYYEGFFLQNKREGFGRFWYGDRFYQGLWENDAFHGEGMLVEANGNRYEGRFVCGKKEGRGTFYHLQTGQVQEGYWINEICESSIIEDIYWRQSVIKPTPYPVPQLKLKTKNIDEILKNIKFDAIEPGTQKWGHDPPVGSKHCIQDSIFDCVLRF